MKKDVTDFVVKCLTCQKVKVEHQKSADTLQRLDILEWKWDKSLWIWSWDCLGQSTNWTRYK